MTMNIGVARRDLGAAGLNWVRRRLAEGHEFSASVAANVNLDSGHVYGFFPSSASVSDIQQFEVSFSGRARRSIFRGAAKCEDALLESTRTAGAEVLLLETAQTRYLGERASAVPHTRSFVRGHLFLWTSFAEATNAQLAELLASEGGYDNAFCLARANAREAVVEVLAIATELDRLVPMVSALLVPAFDGDTFIAWSRT